MEDRRRRESNLKDRKRGGRVEDGRRRESNLKDRKREGEWKTVGGQNLI